MQGAFGRLQGRRIFRDPSPAAGGDRRQVLAAERDHPERCHLGGALPDGGPAERGGCPDRQGRGYMPMEPVSVQKSQPNQTMLEDVADIRESQLEELRDGSSVMVKIPVIFRDRWQLYQTTTGAVYAFDTELLKLIDFKEVSPECRITPHGNMAMFLWEDVMVFLAPGRFSRENEEKILYIAGMDWENQVEADDPVVNLNLFNADQDEPLLTPEE